MPINLLSIIKCIFLNKLKTEAPLQKTQLSDLQKLSTCKDQSMNQWWQATKAERKSMLGWNREKDKKKLNLINFS